MKRIRSLLTLCLLLSISTPAWSATQLFDSSGRVIANLRGTQSKRELKLSEIPRSLQCSVIAMEDARFYSHHGVDIRGTARALFADLIQRKKAEGGSTITQQLARNLYLSAEKSIQRKANEALLAIKLERTMSKDQILEMYLNRIYWGHGAYGAEAAAQTYFGKSARDLSLPESALLAGLVQSPENYSPFRSKDVAKRRQRIVLNRLAELGYIKPADAERYKRWPLRYSTEPGESYRAPYFTSWMIHHLSKRYGEDVVLRGNLKVWTTLDLSLQEQAEAMVKQLVNRKGARYRFNQAAFVLLDPRTGYIRALVGGKSFRESQYNRATMAVRQAGSTIKPFIYLTAFARGLSPEATASDTPVVYHLGNGKRWVPKNYGGEKDGIITLRQALERSNNVIAVKLLKQVGTGPVIETIRKAGITTPLADNLSLGLGSSEVNPLEMASAYGVFANGGLRVEPIPFTRVAEENGRILEEKKPEAHRVFDERSVARLNPVLSGVSARGTATGAGLGRPAAGKTGTTDNSRDAWFVGYTPQSVAALWVGNDQNTPMRGATGGSVCAPAWGSLMREVVKN
ncbi:MAG: transglycosylase domain-containing protein, partial [Bacteroidota bacterium]